MSFYIISGTTFGGKTMACIPVIQALPRMLQHSAISAKTANLWHQLSLKLFHQHRFRGGHKYTHRSQEANFYK